MRKRRVREAAPYRGELPLWRAATWGRPYGRNQTGSVGSAKPGAVVKPQRRQFLQTQGPVARIKLQKATQILRAGRIRPNPRDNPRNGVRGKQPMGLGGAKRSRSPSDASPVAFCLLCRHGQSRSPPALRPQARFGAQPPRQRRLLARRWRRNSPCGKRTNPNPAPSSAPFGGT